MQCNTSVLARSRIWKMQLPSFLAQVFQIMMRKGHLHILCSSQQLAKNVVGQCSAAGTSGSNLEKDHEGETPSHAKQQSAACEKPCLDDAVAGTSGSSASGDAESETPSQNMQQSAACERPHLRAGDASTSKIPSHTVQQSAPSGSGGAACEKPFWGNAVAGTSVSSCSSDPESGTLSHTMQQSAACEKPLWDNDAEAFQSVSSASSDAESATPSHTMQQSAACEKLPLVKAAAGTSFSSVSIDYESEAPSHTMQQSVACQRPHVKSREASTASTGMTPSHTVQQSASSGSGGAVSPSQTAEAVRIRRLRRGE